MKRCLGRWPTICPYCWTRNKKDAGKNVCALKDRRMNRRPYSATLLFHDTTVMCLWISSLSITKSPGIVQYHFISVSWQRQRKLIKLPCRCLLCGIVLYSHFVCKIHYIFKFNKESVKNIIQIYFLDGFYVSENMIFIDGWGWCCYTVYIYNFSSR